MAWNNWFEFLFKEGFSDRFNTGRLVEMDHLSNLFVPFSSSKPYGTGFGLSIARLAARKNLGDLYLEPVSDGEVRCVIKLPASMESGGKKGVEPGH